MLGVVCKHAIESLKCTCLYFVLGIYCCPDLKEYDQIIEHILRFPLITKPEIFGLHENADLIKERQESELLLDSVLKTQVNLTQQSCVCPSNSNIVL